MTLLSPLLPPPGRTYTNPGDTYERMFRCDQHQVTWRGHPRCWIGGTQCTLTAL